MNTKNKEWTLYEIISGPKKDLLFDALKYAYDDNCDIRISFKIEYKDSHDRLYGEYAPLLVEDVKLLSLEYVDGPENSFDLRGYCSINFEPYSFKACYNARRRTGVIKLFYRAISR